MTAPAANAADLFAQLTDLLAEPNPPPPEKLWTAHSLAEGAAGTALLHIEAARRHAHPWLSAHRWISAAASGQISSASTTGLFLGAPAVGFLLATTPQEVDHLYAQARTTLHRHIVALAHRRTDAALARIHRRDLANFAEYDIFYGLTGIGAYLLHTAPADNALGRVLSYLVTLTRPLLPGGSSLPGWWVTHDPSLRESARFAGGHGNLGAAHGITGPLLLLAQALRSGIEVSGQREAIQSICEHLDTWRQEADAGPWWPQYLSRRDLERRRPRQAHPLQPSWCYGICGIARAGQLAGIALHERRTQTFYEDTLYRALTDPAQLAQVTYSGLCHGWAGIYQTAARVAADARDPRLRELLPSLGDALVNHTHPDPTTDPGLLTGAAGTALAVSTLATHQLPITGWDACLLIN